jgi:two-component system, sensor histidine kinase and response regulator
MSIEAPAASESAPTGVRVLVVDDDVVICRQMAAGLASAGYQVVTAHDGERALDQAQETPPDLAIVDLEMPGTNGLDVIRRLKQLFGPAVHIIVMTGHDDDASHKEAFDAGTDDFVVKPTGMSELKRRLAAATRNHRAYVEVRVAKEAADRRMAYGAEASALLAHDLNNGLAVALSNLQYLRDVLALDGDQRDALDTTVRSLRRMSSLVANFVDIARFEDAAVKPMVASTLAYHVLESVLEVNASSLQRGVTITIDCEPGLMARFDAALVERVLHNLVGNASRYCNQGGVISVTARRWNDGDDSIEISVTNSGPQIPENIRPQLFGKYVRGGGGKRGMGLYFCRLVAEAHGGRIDYEASGIGPRFVIRLPGRA